MAKLEIAMALLPMIQKFIGDAGADEKEILNSCIFSKPAVMAPSKETPPDVIMFYSLMVKMMDSLYHMRKGCFKVQKLNAALKDIQRSEKK